MNRRSDGDGGWIGVVVQVLRVLLSGFGKEVEAVSW